MSPADITFLVLGAAVFIIFMALIYRGTDEQRSLFELDDKTKARIKAEREAKEAKAKRAIEVHEEILFELREIRQILVMRSKDEGVL